MSGETYEQEKSQRKMPLFLLMQYRGIRNKRADKKMLTTLLQGNVINNGP